MEEVVDSIHEYHRRVQQSFTSRADALEVKQRALNVDVVGRPDIKQPTAGNTPRMQTVALHGSRRR
jgi:hypothetical protein